MSGLFITLEGPDGCGKTTQTTRLNTALLEAGYSVCRLREPGGTKVSEKIRTLLLDTANAGMCSECELLLYEASRAQLVHEVIEPALAADTLVLCDRFFDSTYAYQAGGRGLLDSLVRQANTLGSLGRKPDRTLVLDMPVEQSFARATATGVDRMEAAGLEFQQRVRSAYVRLAKEEPKRVKLVDATGSPEEVFVRVCRALADLLPTLAEARDE
ncbi:MAG: dTMP kinase [Coriobacteriaceae bacterium]|nr:dTMP kinase [Coriobacteriaceae bacterium]